MHSSTCRKANTQVQHYSSIKLFICTSTHIVRDNANVLSWNKIGKGLASKCSSNFIWKTIPRAQCKSSRGVSIDVERKYCMKNWQFNLRFEADLFEGHELPRGFILGLVNDSIGTLADLFYLVEILHNLERVCRYWIFSPLLRPCFTLRELIRRRDTSNWPL